MLEPNLSGNGMTREPDLSGNGMTQLSMGGVWKPGASPNALGGSPGGGPGLRVASQYRKSTNFDVQKIAWTSKFVPTNHLDVQIILLHVR